METTFTYRQQNIQKYRQKQSHKTQILRQKNNVAQQVEPSMQPSCSHPFLPLKSIGDCRHLATVANHVANHVATRYSRHVAIWRHGDMSLFSDFMTRSDPPRNPPRSLRQTDHLAQIDYPFTIPDPCRPSHLSSPDSPSDATFPPKSYLIPSYFRYTPYPLFQMHPCNQRVAKNQRG